MLVAARLARTVVMVKTAGTGRLVKLTVAVKLNAPHAAAMSRAARRGIAARPVGAAKAEVAAVDHLVCTCSFAQD